MSTSQPLPKELSDAYRHTMAFDEKAGQEEVDPHVAIGMPVQHNPALMRGIKLPPPPGQPPRIVSDVLFSEWQSIIDQARPDNVDFLANELFDKLNLQHPPQAQSIINMLYDQALIHVDQQAALACLAHALIAHPKTPEFPTAMGMPGTSYGLRRLLLNKVQEEFELGMQAAENALEHTRAGAAAAPAGPPAGVPKTTASDADIQGRDKMMRNIKFMSHLFNHGLVSETTLHRCITLLEKELEKVGPTEAFDTLLAVLEIAGEKLYATESPPLAGALNVCFERLRHMQLEARETKGKGAMLSDSQWIKLKHALAQKETGWA